MSGRERSAPWGVLLGCGLVGAAACTAPAPAPNLPGTFVGSFAFSGSLLLPGQVAGVGNPPATSCLIGLDGGLLNPATALSFFAYVSEDPDAGLVWWQQASNGSSGPIEQGDLGPWSFTLAVPSCAPMASCGCLASVNETIVLWQSLADSGVPGGLLLPVRSLTGWIDDRLVADASAACLDGGGAQATACSAAAGLGCGLDCDLVYTLSAVPGSPPL